MIRTSPGYGVSGITEFRKDAGSTQQIVHCVGEVPEDLVGVAHQAGLFVAANPTGTSQFLN
jgi:hypothetical protein